MSSKTTKGQPSGDRRERARAVMAKRQQRDKLGKVISRAVLTGGVLVLLAVIGFAAYLTSRPSDTAGPANMISGGAVFQGVDGKAQIVETPGMEKGADPVPTDPSDYDAPARIVTYIDYGCEYCKAFESGNAQQLEEMVASGDATLEVQPVAITGDYAVRAGSATSCLVAQQPEDFFPMLSAMYENQPAEGQSLTNGEILDIWKNAGIDVPSDLQTCVEQERYSDWIQTRTQAVVSDPDVVNAQTGSFGTPTIFVNDVRYQPRDLSDPAEFKAFVEANSSGS